MSEQTAVALWNVGGLLGAMDHPGQCCGIVASSLFPMSAVEILLHTAVFGTSLESTLLLGDGVKLCSIWSFIHLLIDSQPHPTCQGPPLSVRVVVGARMWW